MATVWMVLTVILVAMATRSHCQSDITCEEQESCDSKVNKSTWSMNCGCDKACVAIGDCCHDSVYYNYPKTITTTPECVNMPLVKDTFMINIAMVQKCPTEFEDTYIKERCESLPDNRPFTPRKIMEDFSFFVPVLGKTSQVLFANIFCAVCNGDEESFFLDVDFRNRKPIPLKKFLEIKDLESFDSVFPRTRVTMSLDDYTPRSCRISEDKCDATWPNDETALLCEESPTSYIYHRLNSTVYKNKHCAKCNYMGESNFTCKDPRIFLSSTRGITLFPYSLLFDLNTGTVVSQQERSPNKMEIIAMQQRKKDCQQTEVYDPFHKDCVDILCPDENVECKHFRKFSLNKAKDLDRSEESLNAACRSCTPLSLFLTILLGFRPLQKLPLWEII